MITHPTRVDMKTQNISKIHEPLEHKRICIEKKSVEFVRSKITWKTNNQKYLLSCLMAFTCFCVSGGDSYLQIERQHPACIIRRGMSQSLHKDSTVSSSSRGRDVLLNSGPQASLSSTSGCSWPKRGQLSVKRTWCWPCCELFWSMSLCLHTCAVMLIVHSFINSINSIQFNSIQFHSFIH